MLKKNPNRSQERSQELQWLQQRLREYDKAIIPHVDMCDPACPREIESVGIHAVQFALSNVAWERMYQGKAAAQDLAS